MWTALKRIGYSPTIGLLGDDDQPSDSKTEKVFNNSQVLGAACIRVMIKAGAIYEDANNSK
jgi:hypothetical protein